ncbi:hypothetical protein AAIR98_001095 [Elusimicrobium simillimum]|uniref:hypothetical protein n=1 Tax=Elusimicrobium simillimum TaxID=3143438 RepID=UPI003C6FA2FB
MTMVKNFLNNYFLMPYKTRNVFWATLDVLFKLVMTGLWLVVMRIIGSFVYYAFAVEPSPKAKAWWLCYCLVLFIGTSLLSYTGVFVRKDY